MSIDHFNMKVSGLPVEVVRKSIKNLHVGVYPPAGRVRVAAPTAMTKDAVRLAVINKLNWIKKQRAAFKSQPRQSVREMVTGETHFFFGKRYRLRVVERDESTKFSLLNSSTMELVVRPKSTTEQRVKAIQNWHRKELKTCIEPLIPKWEKIIGVKTTDWGVKRMKTKWGSCNIEAKRIWLNLELAKKPVECTEYIVLHELNHLLVRNHNDQFVANMDRFLPKWRTVRDLLNSSPLAYETWATE